MARPNTPKARGFRIPAEWEPQEAVWFAWPTREDLWPGRIERVREQLARLYRLAASYQAVRVLCARPSQPLLLDLLKAAGGSEGIELYDYQTDDVWIRDYGPLFLLSPDRLDISIADWRFNAWGNKFPQYCKDDQATCWIADQLGLYRFTLDRVLEGGAIESNGQGQLMTTEAVLLNPNRNGTTSIAEVEQELCSGLGVDTVLWLKEGLAGDDTDGHIDNLARFYQSDAILIADVSDRTNPSYVAVQENMARLQNFRTTEGSPFNFERLPLPEPILSAGEPLAASYMNYLVLNGAVLVPTYRQEASDLGALEIIGKCFPDREVIGFDCFDIVHEGGALHCMSQHQPRVISHQSVD